MSKKIPHVYWLFGHKAGSSAHYGRQPDLCCVADSGELWAGEFRGIPRRVVGTWSQTRPQDGASGPCWTAELRGVLRGGGWVINQSVRGKMFETWVMSTPRCPFRRNESADFVAIGHIVVRKYFILGLQSSGWHRRPLEPRLLVTFLFFFLSRQLLTNALISE